MTVVSATAPDYSRCLDALDKLLVEAAQIIREMAPNPDTRGKTSTGNLAFNAIKYEWLDAEHTAFRIYVDESVAPYMKYLNEGEKSIHRGWWERACKAAFEHISEVIG